MSPLDAYLNKIICGDCREIVPQIPRDPEHPIAVIADPPYGKNYRSHHNNNPTGKWAQYRRPDNFKPIIGDDKPFDPSHLLSFRWVVLWGANYYADKLPTSSRWFVWDKLDGKTPAKMQADCELAWTNQPGVSRIYSHLWRGLIRKGRENVCNGPKLHPNQKPVDLMKWCIRQLKLPSGTVILDPYCGSGTLPVAARELGHDFIAMDLDPHWVQVARERLYREARRPITIQTRLRRRTDPQRKLFRP